MAGHVEQLDVVRELLDGLQGLVRATEGVEEARVAGPVELDGGGGNLVGTVLLVALEQEGALATAVVHAAEHRAMHGIRDVNRPMRRHGDDAELGFDVGDQLERILTNAVALVDDREDGHAATAADLEELARALFDALAVVEEHDDGVRGDQRAERVFAEVGVAGSVEQVDLIALVLELQHGARDRDAALLLEGHPVGGGVLLCLACLHGAGLVDGAAVQQQLLRQRGLAGVGMRDDGEGAASRDLVGEGGSGESGCGHG